MYSFGRGVFQKPPIDGSITSADTLYRIHSGQFIYSRLFAFEGGYGIVPANCEGFFVSNEFPTFDCDSERVIPEYLGWMFRYPATWRDIAARSTGIGHRRQRVHPEQLLEQIISLPPLAEQGRIVARIEGVATRLRSAQTLRDGQKEDVQRLLFGAFHAIAAGASRALMKDVAPLVRRPVALSFDSKYPELGIRSFFKGTFHKPHLSALEIGSKRVFWIEPGDLLFSNVFAWEGAIAIAGPKDAHRVGSHRYITCVPVPGVAEARFLLQHFRTQEGFARIQDASPGGAGRNRTLGLDALANISVPIPSIEKQRWFAALHERLEDLSFEQERIDGLYDALVPSVVERLFKSQAGATDIPMDRLLAVSERPEGIAATY
jgi:type I restriction enzyme S subunit